MKKLRDERASEREREREREMGSPIRDGSSVARYSTADGEAESLQPWKPKYFNYTHRSRMLGCLSDMGSISSNGNQTFLFVTFSISPFVTRI
jgi:hypothetical protein